MRRKTVVRLTAWHRLQVCATVPPLWTPWDFPMACGWSAAIVCCGADPYRNLIEETFELLMRELLHAQQSSAGFEVESGILKESVARSQRRERELAAQLFAETAEAATSRPAD
jgi:hypothetical protein